jgi:hypothetical protein
VRLTGQMSEADKEQPGCIFSGRCHRRKGTECLDIRPPWQEVPKRRYRCHWQPAELEAMQKGHVVPTAAAAACANA